AGRSISRARLPKRLRCQWARTATAHTASRPIQLRRGDDVIGADPRGLLLWFVGGSRTPALASNGAARGLALGPPIDQYDRSTGRAFRGPAGISRETYRRLPPSDRRRPTPRARRFPVVPTPSDSRRDLRQSRRRTAPAC